MMFEIVDLPTDTLPVIPINNGCGVLVLVLMNAYGHLIILNNWSINFVNFLFCEVQVSNALNPWISQLEISSSHFSRFSNCVSLGI